MNDVILYSDDLNYIGNKYKPVLSDYVTYTTNKQLRLKIRRYRLCNYMKNTTSAVSSLQGNGKQTVACNIKTTCQ